MVTTMVTTQTVIKNHLFLQHNQLMCTNTTKEKE